jgi:hypothetical protein
MLVRPQTIGTSYLPPIQADGVLQDIDLPSTLREYRYEHRHLPATLVHLHWLVLPIHPPLGLGYLEVLITESGAAVEVGLTTLLDEGMTGWYNNR